MCSSQCKSILALWQFSLGTAFACGLRFYHLTNYYQ
nr:MAG TPA: hypothetical protein [Caudoviricetes sp.]